MKKILIGIVAVLVIIGAGGFGWYQLTYGGKDYYVQIKTDGEKRTVTANDGNKFPIYTYKIKATEKSGQTKDIEFTADHNLRHGAYLDLTYNNKKGVTNWKEVQKDEVPKEALDKLN
ncbi:YxeA family protein [Lactococcus termiticola]|uniref:YxeA family protein n=1 Tax=Lactococcus termiticola TaxID=2169526 RepID=A0A2R5HDS3_9LACT|nr:YxeA family protein [Lactococcus termiticola]GBG96217.1 hypothetical protein NtB2_00328 [Lactococcus termiticola]